MTIQPPQIRIYEGIAVPAGTFSLLDSCSLDLWCSSPAAHWIATTLNASPFTIQVEWGARVSWLLLWRRQLVPGVVLVSGYPYAAIAGDVELFWEVFQQVVAELQKRGVARMELALSNGYIDRCLGPIAARYVNRRKANMQRVTRQVIDFRAFSSVEGLERLYPANVRWSIRKATHEGVTVHAVSADYAETAQALYVQTMREKGAPVYYVAERFRLLVESKGSPGIGRLYLAYQGSVAVGMAAVVDARSTRHLVQLAVPRQFRKSRAADLLVATALREGHAMGQTYFDFMATLNEDQGLGEYKAKWGGVTEEIVHAVIPIQPFQSRMIDYLRRASRFWAAMHMQRLARQWAST